jgi:hypothetical protein
MHTVLWLENLSEIDRFEDQIIILPLKREGNITKKNQLFWSYLAYKLPSKHFTERKIEVTGRRRIRHKQL